MHTRWNSVEDDRGIRREICTIKEAVDASGIQRAGFVRREDASRFWISFFWNGLSFTVIMQIFFIILGVLDFATIFTLFWAVNSAFMFIFYGVMMGLIIKFSGWRSPQLAKRAVLSIGHCPSCTYRLFDIEEESDGCTVCPECGGSWKLNNQG